MKWDDYFLNIAEQVSQRSPDPNTKHGCVIVDKNNRVLSTGYNGPVAGIPNDIVELSRPNKYDWMIHAEDNAVLFAKCDLTDSTAYITGHPCGQCFRRLAQAGVKRIVYGSQVSKCITDYEYKVCHQIAKHLNIEMLHLYEPAKSKLNKHPK